MRLFRLRPLVVQAMQVTGHNHDELATFCGQHAYTRSALAVHVGPHKADGRIAHV